MSMKSMPQKTIAFTGGGTGGHVLPICSLLEYVEHNTQVKEKCKKLYRFGEKGSIEEKKAGTFASVNFVSVYSGKVRRYLTISSILLSIRDFFRLIIGLFQSLRYLKKYKVDVVFCKGGYVVVPVCLAAKVLRIPIVVHESDTHVGLANKLVARLARTIFTGFDGTFTDAFTVGQILSPSLSTPKKVELPGFVATKTTVLCMGGSQGAHAIFAMLPQLIKELGDDFQYIVITGLKNAARKEKLKKYNNVWALGFLDIEEIAFVMNCSDVSITRGSMTSLQEQQIFGIKKIIIPLPFTGGNHQETNADWCVEHRGDQKVLQNAQQYNATSQALIAFEGFKKTTVGEIDMESLLEAHTVIWMELLK